MTTHPLLEELRGLGVQLSTDGTSLNIDAPVGVMTPDLREMIRAQKQDLITGLRSSSPRQDENLYTFASVISHMVDVLGGHVRITRHDPNISLEEVTRTIRPSYQPVALPALKRSMCPHQVMVIKHEQDGDHQTDCACQGRPNAQGWCADHALSHTLLCLGALLGYPSVTLGYREMGEGVVQWEAYAECVEPSHLQRDIASIHTRFEVPTNRDPKHP